MIPITIQGVSKRFGETVALDDVSLEMAAGELFFLLGPSGCGKTTLLRAIAGFHAPDRGRILFGPDEVTNLPPHERQTGMMFQSYALWPHLNVAQNVAFGLEERRVPKAETARRVEEALAAVRMAGLGSRRVHELSGGQQQRVALARALVIRPRCLLLDEPLSNLDARLRVEMRLEIRRICREAGLTAIYVTHDQKEALSIADRMAVMHNGRLLQVGTPAEVYRQPRSRFVAEFMGETNLIPGTVEAVTPGGTVTVQTPLGLLEAVAGTGSLAAGAEVLLSARPECWRLSDAGAAVNRIAGTAEEPLYLGETTQLVFIPTAAPEHRLRLTLLNLPPAGLPSGTRSLTIAPEDLVVL